MADPPRPPSPQGKAAAPAAAHHHPDEHHERKGLFKVLKNKVAASGWGLHLPGHDHHGEHVGGHHLGQHQGNHHAPLFPSPKSPLGHSAPAVFSDASPRPRLPPISRSTAESVMAALDYLGATALGTEGLYRVSGSTVETGKLTRLLEVGTNVSVDTLDLLDKHVIACAIKKVLQEHEPLLPYGLFDAFVAVPQHGRATSSEDKARSYRELVDLLPPVSRALLGHLMLHLKQVADHSSANRMTPENLSLTIGVNLLRPSESVEGTTLQRLEKARAVVRDLVVMAEPLFGEAAREQLQQQQQQQRPPSISLSPLMPLRPPSTRGRPALTPAGLGGDDRIDGPPIRFFDLPRALSSGVDGHFSPSRAVARQEEGRSPPVKPPHRRPHGSPPAPPAPSPPPRPSEQEGQQGEAAARVEGLGQRLDAVVTLARADSPPALDNEGGEQEGGGGGPG